MTTKRIDFYTAVAKPEQFACRLTQTVYRSAQRLLVLLDDEPALRAFSTRLWCLGDTLFIPHCRPGDSEAAETPVWLSTAIPDGSHCPSVLLNLSVNDLSGDADHFERILEIVGGDDTSLACARRRFRYYRECQYDIEHHDMSKLSS